MNIFVCVKPVPDPDRYNTLSIDSKSKRLVREGIPTVVDSSDKSALEAALQIKASMGGKITVISMAPDFYKDKIVECLAMGADEAFLASDVKFGGADTLATSYTLMKTVHYTGCTPDLILTGSGSADGATSHVPTQLAEWLALPHLTNVYDFDFSGQSARVWKKIGASTVHYEVTLPALFSIDRSFYKPRLISAMGVIQARNKKLEILSQEKLRAEENMIGAIGSPTQAGALSLPDMDRVTEEITGEPSEIAEKLISIMRKSGVAV
jgi:electron transfer flavoprotein beta subunit